MLLARLALIRAVREKIEEESGQRVGLLKLRRKLRLLKDEQIAAKLKAEGAPKELLRTTPVSVVGSDARDVRVGGKILDALSRALKWLDENKETIARIAKFFIALLGLAAI